MRTDAQYLWDIVEAADAIERFITGKSFSQFQSDDMLRSAIHAKLIIIGEAVTQLSETLTAKYPAIPWVQIRGFRNIAIHGYFKIDWDIVWGAAIKDAPVLRKAATEILAKEFPHLDPEHL